VKQRSLWPILIAAALLVPATASHAQYPAPGGGGPGGPGGFGGGGRRGGFRGRGGNILRMPEVQKELNLSKAQIDKIEALPRPGRGGGPGGRGGPGGPGGPGGGGRGDFEKFRQEREKAIAKILDAKQLARYKQLQLQREGIRAIGRKDIGDQLKLTADQHKKVDAALKSERDAAMKAFQGMRGGGPGGPGGPGGGRPGAGGPGGPGGGPSPEMRKMFDDMRKRGEATEKTLKAVLTPAQTKQFAEMQGKPFKFPAPSFGPGGPGGGGRGPGGGGRPGGTRA
jgi:translation initiation factor IF-2